MTSPTRTILLWSLIVAGCLLMGLFLLWNNGLDWDFFYASMEVDRRAWLFDKQPPLWSYQLCGGSSRIGDPQSFGLSPLFLFVLLFGSLWGTKVLVWFCFALGFYFTYRVMQLLHPSASSEHRLLCAILSLCFVGSYAFLWHLAVGHVTFSITYLAIGIVYYTLKAWLDQWQPRDWFPAVLLTWTYYMSGFYLAQIFFLLPFFVAVAGLLIWQLIESIKQRTLSSWFHRVALLGGFHLIGLALASYKLLGILRYQQQFPRALHTQETPHFGYLLLSPFLPTWNNRFLGLWQTNPRTDYFIWEYSFFHLAGWGLLIYGLYRLARRHKPTATQPEQTSVAPEASSRLLTRFFWLYGFVVLGFAVGDVVPFSFHALLNRYVTHGSIRVIYRYQFGFVFLLHLLLGWVLLRDRSFQGFFRRYLALPFVVVLLLSGLSFWPMMPTEEWTRFRGYAAKNQPSNKMKMFWTGHPMRLLRYYPIARSAQYRAIVDNIAMSFCYQGIRVETRVRRSMMGQWMLRTLPSGRVHRQRRQLFPLIDHQSTPVPASCMKQSYVTQQRIVLHKSCPQRVCLFLSDISPKEAKHFVFDPKRRRFCRK
jgi:hypothetical protein